MKTIKIDLNRQLKNITIVPIADLHIGDPLFDDVGLEQILDAIKSRNDAFIILNGDLINNAIKTSVSDIYSEILTPMEQLKKAVDYFKPVKDKILCVTSGNHSLRTYKDDGIDLTRIFCRELGIEDRYGDESAVLFVRFGELSRKSKETNGSGNVRRVCYTMFVTHGCGGGSTAGSKTNRVQNLSNIIDTDIYIHSHTHLPLVFKNGYFRTDTRNSSVEYVEKTYINTSSQLDYGGYGERFNFKPNSKAFTCINLNGTYKEITVEL